MPVTVYKCTICLTMHKSETRALSCEKKGRPRLLFNRNQKFTHVHPDGPNSYAVILDHRVILRWGKHINFYKVDWSGRITHLSEKTISEYITKKFWVPD